MIAVVDYGMCNLDSIRRALEECDARVVVTDDPKVVIEADRCVVPGVGAFSRAAEYLRTHGLADALMTHALVAERPLLGICLGMQLLGEYSEEGVGGEGLGLIPARIVRLQPTSERERVPHMGWNDVDPVRQSQILPDPQSSKDFYFVHSYCMVCQDPDNVVATTPYCGQLVSVVERGSVFGTQFHPEKSQAVGFELLRNFLSA